MKFKFEKINISKKTVVFTWDDNLKRHTTHILPIFRSHNIRCSFYINPGEKNFADNFLQGYKEAYDLGFEIGSHGYVHIPYISLEKEKFKEQLILSREFIYKYFGIFPYTFAFPNHAFDNSMLELSKKYFLETRNTLKNEVFIALKTKSKIEDIMAYINTSKQSDNIIFAGHSVYLNSDELKNPDQALTGYKPFKYEYLKILLEYLVLNKNIQILTFIQAVIKQFIIDNCSIDDGTFEINDNQLFYLETFGINKTELEKLV